MSPITSKRSTPGRPATWGAALLMLLVLAAAGCDRAAGEPPAAAPTNQLSSSPTGAASTEAGVATAEPAGSIPANPGQLAGQGEAVGPTAGPATASTGYPDNAQAYSEAILHAWHTGDLGRLAELTTALVHEQLLQIPGPVSHDWTQIQCDGGDCSFYNPDGDYLLLHIQLSQFGQPHAANHVTFQPTTYPVDHLDYLKEFVVAWQHGNLARMHALALPEVVEAYQQFPPAPVTDYGLAGGGGGLSIVVVTTVSAEIETHIGTTLLGGPQAIRQAVPEV